MDIEQFVNTRSLTTGFLARKFLPIFTILLIVLANYGVFVFAPGEQMMGPVQRLFYFHVSFAICCYFMVGILFFGSTFYLSQRKSEWNLVARAGAEVGFLLASLVLLSGMIWGHSAWNTWWNWEPRLVSFLILWLILFSYLVLRSYTSSDSRQSAFAAVLGILAAVNVPIVMVSIRFLDHSQQLHPKVVADQGLQDERYVYVLLLTMVAGFGMSLWFFVVKLTHLVLENELKLCILKKGSRRSAKRCEANNT